MTNIVKIIIKANKHNGGEYSLLTLCLFISKRKTDGKEKREKVTVEEFIGRLIRHIPDENFKIIRYYGVYSRKKKAECKQKVAIFQETVKRQIVKVKKVLKKRNWSQRIKDQTA